MNFVVDTTEFDSVTVPAPRPVLREAAQTRPVRGTYDAARLGDEFKNYWAHADRFDADSANSKEVRHRLASHSRYEMANNGYADGIGRTYSTDLIGPGPVLRMQTNSAPFNRMVELVWFYWTSEVRFRQKLWTMAHAKHTDGEALAILLINPSVRHRVQLDFRLYETEQCQSRNLVMTDPSMIDGIKLDGFGNPLWYEFLTQHPGAANKTMSMMETERVPAERVLHWFKMRRPGQHRGVPEMASTLNTGASFRRWREATVAAAETAADYSVLIKSGYSPERVAEVDPMVAFEIEKRMAVTLPEGWSADQMKAEHPNSTYDAFHKTLINEMARPISMPLNKAGCNSADYNYASGRLDHQTYFGSLDVERLDCNEQVLDRIFEPWFDFAVFRYGWLGGRPLEVSRNARVHSWDWPKHAVADVESEANANRTELESGQKFLHTLFTDKGMDLEDELPKAALTFGIGEDELRKRLLDVLLPEAKAEPKQIAKPKLAEPLAARMNGHAVGASHEN